MIAKRRFVAVVWIVVFAGAACTRGKDEANITPQPTDDTRVEEVARFQLVGTITKVFAGVAPPVEIPDDDETVAGPTDEPGASPVGSQAAEPGVLRIELEDVNQDLTDACGVAEGEEVVVYWTSETSFDPDDVLADLEDEIEDRVAGIAGSAFRPTSDGAEVETSEPTDTPEPTQEPDLADASPFAIDSPDTADDDPIFGDESDCVLVAEQVGFEQDAPARTQAPSVRRTSAPMSRPTDAAEPDETDEPDEPDETAKPKKTSAATATPTAEQQ